MAKKFLSQLLKTENCVRSNDRQCCVICLEEISSLSTRTGVIECQIRLPCNHLVGSYCIATWLHDNNTCPVCRSALFPAQPRPHLEPGTVQGDDDHADDASDDDPHRLHWLAVYSARDTRGLGLSHAARLLSQSIVRRASPMDALRECSRLHLCRLAPYPPSWESWVTYISETIIPIWYCAWVEISSVIEISQGETLDTYRVFHPPRESVVDVQCLYILRKDRQHASRGSLPSLACRHPLAKDDAWCGEAFWYTILSRLEMSSETRFNLMGLSRRFVLNLIHKTYLHTTNIMELAALSIYLASCLKELPMTCGPIASATGVSEDDIRAIRARFYPHREELLEYRHYEAMRRTDSTERTLGFLAPEVPSPV